MRILNRKINLKKVCSVTTAVCFLFTIFNINLYANVKSEYDNADALLFKDTNNDKSVIDDKYGKITALSDNGSDTVVINIQDLHCDYSVQKNISNIIKQFAAQYPVKKIYIEGGVGKIDTNWATLIDASYRDKVLDNLLKIGRLTGAEYYAITNENKVPLYGIEDEKIYQDNLNRYERILKGKQEVSKYISRINREIDFLKTKYLNAENKKLNEIIEQYNKGKLPQDKYFSVLLKYSVDAGISLSQYPNLSIYLGLYDGTKEINIKKVMSELQAVNIEMKETISFSRYKEFLDKTENMSDAKTLKSMLEKFCSANNIDFAKKYRNLYAFLELKNKALKFNQIELVKEEKKLISDIRVGLSKDITDLEISYLSDFNDIFSKYLLAELNASQWNYFQVGFDKFRQLYTKYSISDDVGRMEPYFSDLNKFYEVNSKRDLIFVDKMGLPKNQAAVKSKSQTVKDILADSGNIVILISGGFHSSGVDKILNNSNITTVTVTPNLVKVTADMAKQNYENILKQRKIQTQTIALKLLSNENLPEQTRQIILSMLSKNAEGAEISDLAKLAETVLSKSSEIKADVEKGQLNIKLEDGSTVTIDVPKEVADIISRQSINQVPKVGEEIVRVAGDNLSGLLNYFKSGEGIFVPQVFEICKGLCIFAVNNKWYIGDGAIWEIEQARQSGTISAENLDGIEPVVYEYMPGFMQQAIKAKEEKNGRPKLNFGRQLKTIVTKALSLVLISVMLLSTTSCSLFKQEEEVTWPQTSSYVLSQSDREEQLQEINEELMLFSQFDAADGTAGDGKYNSFLYDEMSQANKNMLSDEDIIVLQDMRNLYDQALIALNFMEDFRMEEARQVLQAINNQGYLYKSNLEERVITGEVLWVGIAARQYKLLTMGSTEFDGLIAKCDKWVTAQTTGQYLFGNSSWDWVSAEHTWDAIAYLRLKLYCDDLYGEVGMSRLAATENMKLFMFSIINNMYDPETGSFYRGALNDKYSVLDANTWGIQVLIMLKTTYPVIYNFEYEQGSAKDISIPKVFDYIENNFAKTVTINGKTYSNLYMAATESSNPVMFEWSLQVAGSYRMAANMYAAEGNTELAEQYAAKADAIERDVKAYAADLGIDEGLPYIDTNGALIYQSYGWKGFTVPAVAPIAQPSVSFFTQIQPVIPASYQGTVDMKIKTYEDGYKEFYLFFQSYESENSQAFKDITARLDNLGIKYYTESAREDGKNIIKLYIIPTDYRLQNSGIVWPGIISDSQTPNSILPTTIPFINNLISHGRGTIGNILLTILKKETVQSLFKPLAFKKGHTSQAGQKGAGIVIGATHISMTAAVFATIALLLTPVMSFFAVPLLGGITLGAIAVAIAFMTGIVVNIITHAIIDFRYIKALGFEIKMNQYGRENVRFTEEGLEITGDQKATNIKSANKVNFLGKVKRTFVKVLLVFFAVALIFSTVACNNNNNTNPSVTTPGISIVEPSEIGYDDYYELMKYFDDEEEFVNSYYGEGMVGSEYAGLSTADKTEISQDSMQDQALAVLTYTRLGKYEDAKKILDEMNAQLSGTGMSQYMEANGGKRSLAWWYIASEQYFYKTGDVEVLSLLKALDSRIFTELGTGFDGGRRQTGEVGGWESEYQLEEMAAIMLKLDIINKYTGDATYGLGKSGYEESKEVSELKARLTELASNMGDLYYIPGSMSDFYTDYNVLDTFALGIKVLCKLELEYPEIYTIVGINQYEFFKYSDKNFATTITVNGKTYTDLYRGGTDESLPVSFEMTLQMATAYKIAAETSERQGNTEKAAEYRQKAEAIVASVLAYTKDMGYKTIPSSDRNEELFKNGEEGYRAPSLGALAAYLEYNEGSYFDGFEAEAAEDISGEYIGQVAALISNFDAGQGISNSYFSGGMPSGEFAKLSASDQQMVMEAGMRSQGLAVLTYIKIGDMESAKAMLLKMAQDVNNEAIVKYWNNNGGARSLTWWHIACEQYYLVSGDNDVAITRFMQWFENSQFWGLSVGFPNGSRITGQSGAWESEYAIEEMAEAVLRLKIIEKHGGQNIFGSGDVNYNEQADINRTKERISQLGNQLRNMIYDQEGNYYTDYTMADTYALAVQMLCVLEKDYPGIAGEINIDMSSLLSYIENNFKTAINENGEIYINLYRAASDRDLPVSFEATLQIATAYKMAADIYESQGNTELASEYRQRAQDIVSSVVRYTKDAGYGSIPSSNENDLLFKNGEKGYRVPSLASLAGYVQFEKGSFFMPFTESSEAVSVSVSDTITKTNSQGVAETYICYGTYASETDTGYVSLIGELDAHDVKYFEKYVVVVDGSNNVQGTQIKVYILQSDPNLDDTNLDLSKITPKSILPATMQLINNLIAGGKGTMGNIIWTILKKETWQSVINPKGFEAAHPTELGKQGASRLGKVVKASSAVAFLTTAGSLATVIVPMFAMPVVGILALAAISLIAAFVVRFPASVIAHTIIDVRHIKSLGLEDAIKKYGKDNVMLADDGVVIKSNPLKAFKLKYMIDQKPVYVISDKPENPQEFNFKPVPVNFVLDGAKVAKTWLGSRKGATIVYIEWLRYDDLIKKQYGEIIRMLQESRYFQDKYGTNASSIEIDFNNPDRQLEYSESGNIIIGLNEIQTNGRIDSKKVVSLLRNSVVDAVTVNRNSAIQVDVLEGLATYADLEKFISEAKTADTRLIFSEEEFNKIMQLIRQELSKNSDSKDLEELVAARFLELTKDAADARNNLSVTIRYSSAGDTSYEKETKYAAYGITSFIFDSQFGSKYYDKISGFTSDIKEISDLNDMQADGFLYVFKLSRVVKEIEESSSIFTFLKSVNINKILKQKNVNFVTQAARNFDFDQFPELSPADRNNIIDMLRKAGDMTDYGFVLDTFFGLNSSVVIYFGSLKTAQLRNAFAKSVLERMLLVGYLRDNGITKGFANKSYEELLTNMLLKKYLNSIGDPEITDTETDILTLDELASGVKAGDLSVIERQKRLDKKIYEMMPAADDTYRLKFTKARSGFSKEQQAFAINGIIKLLTLYADNDVNEAIAVNTNVINMANVKSILTAA